MRLTKLVPAPLRAKVKSVLRERSLDYALNPLRSAGTMTEPQIAAFLKAWGDDGFSADTTYIGQIIRLMNTGSILECGTGATTLVENELGLRRGLKIYCLEQNLSCAQNMIGRNLEAVKIIHAPLKQIAPDHQWYDIGDAVLPMHFSVVICDGPYIDVGVGEPTYSGWRYGVMPWLKSTGRTFDTMLLDDVVNHERAAAVLARWQREFGVKIDRLASNGGRWAIIRESSQ